MFVFFFEHFHFENHIVLIFFLHFIFFLFFEFRKQFQYVKIRYINTHNNNNTCCLYAGPLPRP